MDAPAFLSQPTGGQYLVNFVLQILFVVLVLAVIFRKRISDWMASSRRDEVDD